MMNEKDNMLAEIRTVRKTLTILFVIIFAKLCIHNCLFIINCCIKHRDRNNVPPGGRGFL